MSPHLSASPMPNLAHNAQKPRNRFLMSLEDAELKKAPGPGVRRLGLVPTLPISSCNFELVVEAS